jgi:hypothetical protein
VTIDVAKVRKAVVAGVGALSASLVTGASDGALSGTDWVIAGVAAVAAGWATWRVPNRVAPPAAPSDAGPVVDEHVAAPGS